MKHSQKPNVQESWNPLNVIMTASEVLFFDEVVRNPPKKHLIIGKYSPSSLQKYFL